MNARGCLAFVAAAFAAIVCVGCRVPKLAAEKITSLRCDVEVREDGTVRVLETFNVRSTGDRVQHGVWREFPADHVDCSGNRRPFNVEVEEVRQNGDAAEHFLFAIPGASRVYIGNRDAILPPGDHEYSVCYSTSPITEEAEGRLRICWEVTGFGWALPIDELEAVFRLPISESGGVEADLSRQPADSDGERVTVKISPGGVKLATQERVDEGQRLQIRISWPTQD